MRTEGQLLYILVNGFQYACDGQVVFQFHSYGLVCEGLEQREYQLKNNTAVRRHVSIIEAIKA